MFVELDKEELLNKAKPEFLSFNYIYRVEGVHYFKGIINRSNKMYLIKDDSGRVQKYWPERFKILSIV